MSSDGGTRETGWASILGTLSPETRLFALIALLAEAGLGAMTLALPSGQRIYAFIAFIFLLGLLVWAAVRVVSRSKSHDHDYALRFRVDKLRERLIGHDFLPQLIVGLSRSGLAAAGMLAKRLGKERIVPVISLIRLGAPGDFVNRFNVMEFGRHDFHDGAEQPIKVLIVDDIARSGRTLVAAKSYVEDAIGRDFVVKTAALTFYAESNSSEPSFVVQREKRGSVRDVAGVLEPRSD